MPGVWFLWRKKTIIIFKKEKWNTFTPLIIYIVKVFIKRKIAQIYYDPQSDGINLQSPQSESTPKRLTLGKWWMWGFFPGKRAPFQAGKKSGERWLSKMLSKMNLGEKGRCKLVISVSLTENCVSMMLLWWFHKLKLHKYIEW